ncbi:AbrB/MazE/SpoVT family DNA-binding domain-containing protein [Bacillus toyonensis]|uniref:AbrB/MazE/SpoVT family DNA-binding domain-containing protein n=1 Tax=Bacillus toyonensis TaxID=155322 RepID=UPI000BEF1BB7|nr:AbrB/MazE/SpoVT family DNA-binding domain-containing protein [Bacillus toyonensis]PEL24306.1 AbrB/MazE/SpoVT family DNA-binding domain-containing protein [Bacillus toyonensis]
MERKLRKIGNSVGLLLPKDVLEHMNLKEGEDVEIRYDADRKEIILRNKKIPRTSDESEIRGIVLQVLKELDLA